MKTVGIIGGIGPESTIDYYRSLIALYREQRPDGSSPSIVINSIDQRILHLIVANKLQAMGDCLVAEVHKLARAGADFGLLAANTPHIVFDYLQRESPIPLLSIVQATCEAAKALGYEKLGLFGTRFIMRSDSYSKVFSTQGIELVVPNSSEQAYIHDKYMKELLGGIFLPSTRDGLLRIMARLKEQEGIQGLILGGTELPMILRDVEDQDIPFLDTTKIHVRAAVAQLLA
jgi:aspartate racemase